uniref:Anaphase-promoting complex subunit 4 WD40 domain-containing protein n=1 Tax=Phaeomonas parva TaxID=124430 RepID=A0A7S1TT28_9STRA
MAFSFGSGGGGGFGGGAAAGGFGATTGGFGASAANPAVANPNPNNDLVVPSPPGDTVSQLALNDNGTGLLASSWDGKVSFWQVARGPQVTVTPQAQITHEGPALCCGFASDGTTAFSGGADGKVKMWQLGQANRPEQQVGAHDAPVKCLTFCAELNMLITAGWDKKLKFWDCRSPNPAGQFDLPERAYCMSAGFPYLGVATANRRLCFYNLQGQPSLAEERESPLKYQSSCLALFPAGSQRPGFALGSVEGRVAIHYFKGTDKDSFAFKCHRDSSTSRIYAVNAIAFHSGDIFTTMGSDGKFHFWNKFKKTRLKGYEALGESITAGAFNKGGEIFAYAAGYDWREGAAGYNEQQAASRIFLHAVSKEDLEGKGKRR